MVAETEGVLTGRPDVQVRERYERADVLVGIAERFASELDPGVREKLTARPTDPYADDGTTNPALGEHARQRDGSNEALWAEHTESSGANDRQCQPSRLRHACRVR